MEEKNKVKFSVSFNMPELRKRMNQTNKEYGEEEATSISIFGIAEERASYLLDLAVKAWKESKERGDRYFNSMDAFLNSLESGLITEADIPFMIFNGYVVNFKVREVLSDFVSKNPLSALMGALASGR